MRATRAHLLIFIPAELTNGPVSLRRWPSLIHADPPMDMYSARYALSSLLFLFAPIPLRALQTCRTVLNNYTADMETPPKQVQSGSTRRAVVEREDRQLHCPRWSSCHSSYLGHLHSARCFHFPFTHLVAMIHHNLQKKPAMSLVSSPNVSCKYFRLLFITYLRYLHALLSSIKFASCFIISSKLHLILWETASQKGTHFVIIWCMVVEHQKINEPRILSTLVMTFNSVSVMCTKYLQYYLSQFV